MNSFGANLRSKIQSIFPGAFGGAAQSLGVGGQSQSDDAAQEAEAIRKKKLALAQMQRQQGAATPYSGAFSSLMNNQGNMF